MKRGVTVPLAALLDALLVALWLPGVGSLPAAAQDKPPARLIEEYNRESSPKKQAKIAIELTRERLKELLPPFKEGDEAQEAETAGNYTASLDLLGKAVRKASNGGTSKNAEVELSEELWQLGNLKIEISVMDQPQLDKIIQQADSLHQEILYTLMDPSGKSAKK